MEEAKTLAEVTMVTLVSVTLAFGLVWLGLLGAFHLLPASPRPPCAAARPAREAAELCWAATRSKTLPRAFKAGLGR